MPLKLMCIFAHPDDESLGTGPTLARYAAEGVENYLVCATRGERGWKGPKEEYPGPAALGELREAELRAAAEVLGIRQVCFLDYLDAELDSVDPVEATTRIARHIREIRPQVVITFAPDGAYGHPDHIAISQLATAAVVEAAPQHKVAKLYYMVETADSGEAYQAAFGTFAKVVDGEVRQAVTWDEWAITTRLDTGDYIGIAWQAISCHRSQLRDYRKLQTLSPEQWQAIFGRQHYYRAYSLVNGGRRLETDLFEGVR